MKLASLLPSLPIPLNFAQPDTNFIFCIQPAANQAISKIRRLCEWWMCLCLSKFNGTVKKSHFFKICSKIYFPNKFRNIPNTFTRLTHRYKLGNHGAGKENRTLRDSRHEYSLRLLMCQYSALECRKRRHEEAGAPVTYVLSVCFSVYYQLK